jgi:SecD/SecF fusion protein
LLPIVALWVFGGATLKDFAFALIVGVTSGAYSSIFIAAPLLTMWKERREPEFAKRKKLAEAGAIETVDGKGRRVTGTDAIAAEVAESEQALAAESTPGIVDVVESTPSEPGAQARREKRRQRRSSRPHGRAR